MRGLLSVALVVMVAASALGQKLDNVKSLDTYIGNLGVHEGKMVTASGFLIDKRNITFEDDRVRGRYKDYFVMAAGKGKFVVISKSAIKKGLGRTNLGQRIIMSGRVLNDKGKGQDALVLKVGAVTPYYRVISYGNLFPGKRPEKRSYEEVSLEDVLDKPESFDGRSVRFKSTISGLEKVDEEMLVPSGIKADEWQGVVIGELQGYPVFIHKANSRTISQVEKAAESGEELIICGRPVRIGLTPGEEAPKITFKGKPRGQSAVVVDGGEIGDATDSYGMVLDMIETPDEAANTDDDSSAETVEEKEDPAVKALEAADQLRIAGKYSEALKKYDSIAKEYSASSEGKTAAEKAEAMRKDPEIKAQIEKDAVKKECKRLLSMAESYTANKMHDKAREYLQQIIDKYPNTDYAAQAKKKLFELP